MQPLLLDLVKKSGEYLAARGIANGRREAEWIFTETLNLTRMDLYTRFDMPVEASEVERLRALLMRRAKREPLAYVLGNQDFMGLRLRVGPGVLVPRPETEELVEMVLAKLPTTPVSVLDIGTGSGAIALAVKRARPDCQVTGLDRSVAALAYARDNAQRCGLAVEFVLGDLAEGRTDCQVVLANLPYVAERERSLCDPELAYEPAEALFSGVDGLDAIRALLADAGRFLAMDGVLWLEHGFNQAMAIRELCAQKGLIGETMRDGAGKDRFARICRKVVSDDTQGASTAKP